MPVKPFWFYQQQNLGYNYRLSDIHAALGLSQIKKVNQFIKKRNLIAKYYKNELKKLPIIFQKKKSNAISTVHLFIILVPQKIHKKLFDFLRARKIFVNIHYIPVHLHPYYKSLGFLRTQFKNSLNYYNRALSLPVYFDLKKKRSR